MKKLKIIFLDIDGVLNVMMQTYDEYGSDFHPQFVENLKNIIDKTGAKIVITSTWRFSGLQYLIEMWKYRNLPGEIIDITPSLNKVKRGVEIKSWLDKNKNINVTHYVIIDDDTDFLPEQKKYFVKTSGNKHHEDCVDIGYGLTKICSEKAIDILNK